METTTTHRTLPRETYTPQQKYRRLFTIRLPRGAAARISMGRYFGRHARVGHRYSVAVTPQPSSATVTAMRAANPYASSFATGGGQTRHQRLPSKFWEF